MGEEQKSSPRLTAAECHLIKKANRYYDAWDKGREARQIAERDLRVAVDALRRERLMERSQLCV